MYACVHMHIEKTTIHQLRILTPVIITTTKEAEEVNERKNLLNQQLYVHAMKIK